MELKKNIFKKQSIALYQNLATKVYLRKIMKKRPSFIIMLHNIDNGCKDLNSITYKEFENLIVYFKKINYKFVYTSDIFKEKEYTNKISITFDDGYKNIQNILPIIKNNNIPIDVFLCNDFIGKTKYFSYKSTPPCFINSVEYDSKTDMIFKFLDFTDIKCAENTGFVRFHFHSKSHYHLTELNKSDLEKQICNICINEINDHLLIKMEGFAYPYGCYNLEVMNLVKKYFKYALSVERNILNKDMDLLRIPRISYTGNLYTLTKWICELI